MLLALLWVGLLAPGWVREHNARSAQRNAIRLQQTLRAMASTSEVPEVVELEARARTVRVKQRELKQVRKIEAEAERAAARAEAERREVEARLGRDQAEQALRESSLRAEAWRLASEAREARLEEERRVAEEAMADANARREAAARARAAAAAAEAREAKVRAEGTCAADRWANGASGSERAVERRLTGEQPALSGKRESEAAARRRRGRLASTLVGLVAIAAIVVGAIGIGAGFGLPLLIVGIAALGISVWMLVRINGVWQAQAQAQAARDAKADQSVVPSVSSAIPEARVAPAPQELVIYDVEPEHVARTAAPDDAWTPVPVPRPLYLDRDVAEPTPPEGPDGGGPKVTDADIMELLREEARKSANALRTAQSGVPALPNRAVAEGPAAERLQPITVNSSSSWSEVGDLDALVGQYGEGELANLDSVLRRRRAG
ncbi:hypothetical protein C7K25_08815 [Gulosibacter molinativorax]|uniref:Large exoprotein n=1 Tax=Gulosibacter molinativorax TaxID=256821 RepID=A0ABT7C8A6_9MICO|nr:hypothetical protein [Gulosibacter molinativorax]